MPCWTEKNVQEMNELEYQGLGSTKTPAKETKKISIICTGNYSLQDVILDLNDYTIDLQRLTKQSLDSGTI